MQLGSGFGWKPERAFLLAELASPVRRKLNLSTFPMGVDNAHIDVAIDRLLRTKVSELIDATLNEHLEGHKLPVGEVDQDIALMFGELHSRITQNILGHEAKESLRDRTQLYQLALLKLILGTADRELTALREQLEETLSHESAQISSGSSPAHSQLLYLGRNHKVLRYKAVKHVLYIQRKIEHRGLRKLRKSMLGISWPTSEELLFNPLLQLGGLDCETEFLKSYPLVLRDQESFKQINQIVCKALADWLPAYTNIPATHVIEADLKSLPMRSDSGELPGYAEIERFMRHSLASAEFKNDEICWLDDPDNLEKLLGGCGDEWPNSGTWHNKYWAGFQKNLIAKLEGSFTSAKLLNAMLASLEIESLLNNVSSKLHPAVVFEYLTGKRTRKSLLSQQQGSNEIEQLLASCDEVKKRIKQLSGVERQRRMVQVLVGYARLRRDMKCAWSGYQGMERLRLLEEDDDQELSRTNGLLRGFSANVSSDDAPNEVVGTVIIKADLRGSTALTTKMRDSELNPAVYFSENLFRPINQLLDEFAAVKVFLEGDAIIIALLQYEHPDPDDRIVARACGLANRMLEVVKSKNRNNRKHHLPELELGIGIAYIDEPPTYLFDDSRKITISPAINRADRLSSCAPSLHAHKLGAGLHGWGVEVVVAIDGDGTDDGTATPLRYNVNGIDLDMTAFRKLTTELSLKKIKSSSLDGGVTKRYYLGRFPDVSGKMSWLVIREAPIQYWDGKKRSERTSFKQYFYEVVSDKKIIAKIRSKLT